ncbi:hypothetical protein SynBIOSE41_00839 [Synechococcus sp. BIOS-E4-1]|nr:hypothetical protein SynBIOSE41_00839 [Synechococcus sp. BIOS-E4-1]
MSNARYIPQLLRCVLPLKFRRVIGFKYPAGQGLRIHPSVVSIDLAKEVDQSAVKIVLNLIVLIKLIHDETQIDTLIRVFASVSILIHITFARLL